MPKKKPLTWAVALDTHELHLRARRASPLTIRARRRHVGLFRDHVHPLRPDQVRLADLREYQCGLITGETSQSGRPLSSLSVGTLSTDLRCFFRFLEEEGLLPTNPADRLERPKAAKKGPGVVLTVTETKRLLAAVEGTEPLALRNRAVVEVFYGTGLRRAELIALDLEDLNQAERNLLVRAGKGERARLLPLSPAVFQRLSDYFQLARAQLVSSRTDAGRALFLNQHGGRLNEGGLRHLLKRLAQSAKLKKPVTPHTLRRTFATHLLQNGANLRQIQLLLGHESLNTTATYLCLDPSELRREVMLKHPREQFEV